MTVRRTSIPHQIREWLLDRVARGLLLPGDRVIEAEVAAALHVSAIPVREAIRELAAIGVLQSAPHRGAWVREVSLSETIQAFAIRAAIEPLAVEEATAVFRGKTAGLRRTVAAIVHAAEARDFAEFQHHNQLFHRAIVAAAGNPVLLRVWDSLAFDVRTRFTMEYLTTVDPALIARQHEPIVAALDRGDAVSAAALLRSHSSGLVAYLKTQMAQSPGGNSCARQSPAVVS